MERVETIFGEKVPCKRIISEHANVAIVEDLQNERHVVHLSDLYGNKKGKERTTREKQIAVNSFDLEGTKKRGRTGKTGRTIRARKM